MPPTCRCHRTRPCTHARGRADARADRLSILVVNDNKPMIAMPVPDILLDRGCHVIGPAGAVALAIALIEAPGRALGGSFLDINPHGEMV
jgi:hypothetical protein